jgi:putative ABC transport system permease protein
MIENKLKQYSKLSLQSFKHRKTRTIMTLIGIIISIAVLFTLISLSLGLQDYVNEQFEKIGADKIFIQAKGSSFGMTGDATPSKLTEKDVEIIQKTNGIEIASYAVYGNVAAEYNSKTVYTMVAGFPSENKEELDFIIEAFTIDLEKGRFFDQRERGKIVVGSKYSNVFEKPVQLNEKLKINGKDFKVIGILESLGNDADDKLIYITTNDFEELFDSKERADMIIAKIEDKDNLERIKNELIKKLDKFRGVNEKTRDYIILTPEELLKTFQNILNIIYVFLIGIGSISLIVGGIGIANTMYTSVLERTKEIGVMKAVGARNFDITLIFLIESAILGFFGGVLGILFGALGAKFVENIASQSAGSFISASMPLWLIVGSLAFSSIIGAISGFFPSRKASKIYVVEALRYE